MFFFVSQLNQGTGFSSGFETSTPYWSSIPDWVHLVTLSCFSTISVRKTLNPPVITDQHGPSIGEDHPIHGGGLTCPSFSIKPCLTQGCSGYINPLTENKSFGSSPARWNSLMPLNRDEAVGCQDLGSENRWLLTGFLSGWYVYI